MFFNWEQFLSLSFTSHTFILGSSQERGLIEGPSVGFVWSFLMIGFMLCSLRKWLPSLQGLLQNENVGILVQKWGKKVLIKALEYKAFCFFHRLSRSVMVFLICYLTLHSLWLLDTCGVREERTYYRLLEAPPRNLGHCHAYLQPPAMPLAFPPAQHPIPQCTGEPPRVILHWAPESGMGERLCVHWIVT